MILNPYAFAAAPAPAPAELDAATQLGGPFTLSESNLRAVNTGGIAVVSCIRLDAAIAASGSTYFEADIITGSIWGVGVGVTDVGGPITATWWSTGNFGYLFYNDGNTYHNGGAVSAGLGSYGTGAVLGFLIKNSKLYVALGGVWSGDPDAETGAEYSGLSGGYYPGIFAYEGGVDVRLKLSAAAMTYPIPTGASTMVP